MSDGNRRNRGENSKYYSIWKKTLNYDYPNPYGLSVCVSEFEGVPWTHIYLRNGHVSMPKDLFLRFAASLETILQSIEDCDEAIFEFNEGKRHTGMGKNDLCVVLGLNGEVEEKQPLTPLTCDEVRSKVRPKLSSTTTRASPSLLPPPSQTVPMKKRKNIPKASPASSGGPPKKKKVPSLLEISHSPLPQSFDQNAQPQSPFLDTDTEEN